MTVTTLCWEYQIYIGVNLELEKTMLTDVDDFINVNVSSRNGNACINGDNVLVTMEGLEILLTNGEIHIRRDKSVKLCVESYE